MRTNGRDLVWPDSLQRPLLEGCALFRGLASQPVAWLGIHPRKLTWSFQTLRILFHLFRCGSATHETHGSSQARNQRLTGPRSDLMYHVQVGLKVSIRMSLL